MMQCSRFAALQNKRSKFKDPALMLSIYSHIWPLMSAKQRKRLFPLLVLMLVSGFLELIGVASIVPFLAVLADPGVIASRPAFADLYAWSGADSTFGFLRLLGLLVFVATLVSITVRAASLYFITHFVRGMAIDLGVARLRRYLAQPYEWFLAQHSSDLGKSVLEEVQLIVSNTITPAVRSISNVVIITVLAAFLIYLEPLGTLAAVALLGVSFAVIYGQLRRRLSAAGRDRREAVRERFQVTSEAMSGIKDVKLHGLEETYVQRFFGPSKRLARHLARSTMFSEMPYFVLEAMAFGGILVFVLYLLWSREGGFEEFLPIIGAFAFAGLKLMPLIQNLFRDISLMRFGDAGLAALMEDMEGYQPVSATDGAPVKMRSTLALHDVSYRYPGAASDVVSGLTFEIQAGTSVGFVGPTGAGKTTVIDILLGLLVPKTGALLVDGVEITGTNRRAWQRGIGYVPQAIYLSSATIAENIAFGVPLEEIDYEQVREAAKLANADEFVSRLPDGYRTEIGENGVRLSGGQRQRLGIARALYKDPDVVVFDEATSALDTIAERAVTEAVSRLEGKKTVLMITHRMSTVARCDAILVFKDGKLVASGNHDELASGNELFRNLVATATAPALPVA